MGACRMLPVRHAIQRLGYAQGMGFVTPLASLTALR